MLHRRQIPEVPVGADEVGEPGERVPGVTECEVDAVGGRKDAERGEQQHVAGDEEVAGRDRPERAQRARPGRPGLRRLPHLLTV